MRTCRVHWCHLRVESTLCWRFCLMEGKEVLLWPGVGGQHIASSWMTENCPVTHHPSACEPWHTCAYLLHANTATDAEGLRDVHHGAGLLHLHAQLPHAHHGAWLLAFLQSRRSRQHEKTGKDAWRNPAASCAWSNIAAVTVAIIWIYYTALKTTINKLEGAGNMVLVLTVSSTRMFVEQIYTQGPPI